MILLNQAAEGLCTELIVIVGPTAVGKTDITLRLAECLQTEIINADSRQIYDQLRIGTAAPSAEQLCRACHHFVGKLKSVSDYYSAAQFEEDAIKLLHSSSSNTMILSGGSMMYVDAVCNGIDEIPTISDEIRSYMKQRYENEGLQSLVAELERVDPKYYAECDLHNPKRVIHALEICLQSGVAYSSLRKRMAKQREFRTIKIGLELPREELYNRINRRVDDMMAAGLLDEAKAMMPFKHYNSLNTVGYKELFAYFDGLMSLEEAIEKIKRNTRIYSRKQMTWFKKDASIRWFHPDDFASVLLYVNECLHYNR